MSSMSLILRDLSDFIQMGISFIVPYILFEYGMSCINSINIEFAKQQDRFNKWITSEEDVAFSKTVIVKAKVFLFIAYIAIGVATSSSIIFLWEAAFKLGFDYQRNISSVVFILVVLYCFFTYILAKLQNILDKYIHYIISMQLYKK